MAYSLDQLQVLLVEDNMHMRALLRSMLQAYGIRAIRDAHNGQQAIDQLLNYTPDIVITDWVMEPVDGIALTRYLRSDDASPDNFLPVIMVTGHTQEWRVLQARDAGVTEFLGKPVSAEGLYQRIQAVIEKPRPFVRTVDFFGPCRRRQNWAEYVGPERRKTKVGRNQQVVQDMDLEDLLQSL